MEDDLPDFDAPVFKVLSRNDTGNAPGHQAGVVIPKDLDSYFPALAGTSVANPTSEKRLRVTLRVPNEPEKFVNSRYQHQTWGGTRSPERRLTDNLSTIRNAAHADDILVIERGLHDREVMRLTLYIKGSSEHSALLRKIGVRRWGPLDATNPPVKDFEISAATADQLDREAKKFELFDRAAAMVETKVQRLSRSAAFQTKIIEIYDELCAVCGKGLKHPVRGSEVEAAHIVPRSRRGANDSRNGFALCRSHHWAFDKGLFGVENSLTIVVPSRVKAISQNNELTALDRQKVRPPNDISLAPAADALKWHLENILLD
jgi:putative restriction endonuclease